jgi:D-aspartate ligase
VTNSQEGPLACVLGEIDLVQALAHARIRCAVAASRDEPARYSRHTAIVLPRVDPWRKPEAAAESLLAFARTRPEPPVLFYDADWDLLLVSRLRDRLAEGMRFVVPEPDLVEDLVDKSRFQALADRVGLPVPKAVRLSGDDPPPDDVDLRFPVVLKPLTRHHDTWRPLARGKAFEAADADTLRAFWDRFAGTDLEVLVQEVVPGPETSIESYHVYVDRDGEFAGEFTGRKLRTWPEQFGYSTALEITRSGDVRELGRELVRRLGFQGVAKFDFKRDPGGGLKLLEVNPRFNLWHHPGALAGVNIPALVYADLTGHARPQVSEARAGVRWCSFAHDWQAARAAGIGPLRWLRWALACEAKSGFARNDPLPLPRALAWRLGQRLRRGSHPDGEDPAGQRDREAA